jgi:hypothetical protein
MKNNPILGSFSLPDIQPIQEKPCKTAFSVPVENKPYNRSVWQNTGDLHLTY